MLSEGLEVDASCPKIVQYGYQVAQAATSAVKAVPHLSVRKFPFLEVSPIRPYLAVSRDAGVALFHAAIMVWIFDPRKSLKTGQGSDGSKLTH
jgi:hypothetical protein